MKIKTLLTATCLVAMTGIASAFTYNFTAQQIGAAGSLANGAPIGAPIIVNVPGYGNVQIEATTGTLTYQDAAIDTIRFDGGEVMTITFLAGPVFNTAESLSIGALNLNGSEAFSVGGSYPGNVFTISLNTGESGLTNVEFVPEPSSALLGILGASLMVFRRRR
jgi:hypothetical protein